MDVLTGGADGDRSVANTFVGRVAGIDEVTAQPLVSALETGDRLHDIASAVYTAARVPDTKLLTDESGTIEAIAGVVDGGNATGVFSPYRTLQLFGRREPDRVGAHIEAVRPMLRTDTAQCPVTFDVATMIGHIAVHSSHVTEQDIEHLFDLGEVTVDGRYDELVLRAGAAAALARIDGQADIDIQADAEWLYRRLRAGLKPDTLGQAAIFDIDEMAREIIEALEIFADTNEEYRDDVIDLFGHVEPIAENEAAEAVEHSLQYL